jgi:protein gp37
MGEETGISWCDMTFNPWIGCTKVSPGCAHCYAERDNTYRKWNPAGWGKGVHRKRTSKANWDKVRKWDKLAAIDHTTPRVFCASLADVLDEEAPEEWRHNLWQLIDECKNLEWLLLTKRPENIWRMLPDRWLFNPPAHIRLGITAENQEMFIERAPLLLKYWEGKNFLSLEPLLGPIELYNVSGWENTAYWWGKKLRFDWVIVGGESGSDARPMDPNWVRSLGSQCQAAHAPFFFKQWGEWAPYDPDKSHGEPIHGFISQYGLEDRLVQKIGRKAAGCLLDGDEYKQFPVAA